MINIFYHNKNNIKKIKRGKVGRKTKKYMYICRKDGMTSQVKKGKTRGHWIENR